MDLADPFLKLHIDFVAAYENSAKATLNLKTILNSPSDPNILLVLGHMKKVLKRSERFKDECELPKEILDFRTIYKLLKPGENEKPLAAKSLLKINEYIILARHAVRDHEINTTINGAYLINNAFKKAKTLPETENSRIEFYTHKADSVIQWMGIIHDFDIKRPILLELKKAVLLAFKHRKSKICAVVIGQSGSGKSTVLRRLAIQCIQLTDFITLWVFDIEDFVYTLKRIKDESINYLVIIEDWNTIELNPTGKSRFLNYLAETKNVRVVIGDYHTERVYAEYIYSENIFYLKSDENKTIIENIVNLTKKFEGIRGKLDHFDSSFFKAPLFVILFVLIRTYINENLTNNLDFHDFSSQFKKIVLDDLKSISKEYKGLVQALYYWATISKADKSLITWTAILKLADYYQKDLRPSTELRYPSENNPIFKILSCYVSLKRMVHPLMDEVYIMTFQHDLLKNALSSPLNNNWYFDDDVLLNLIKVLFECEEENTAGDLYSHFLSKQTTSEILPRWTPEGREFAKKHMLALKNDSRHQYLLSLFDDKKHSLFQEILRNMSVETIYEQLELPEIHWLATLQTVYYTYHEHAWIALKKIVGELLGRGCKSKIIQYAHDMCANNMLFDILIGQILFADDILSTVDKIY